MNVFITFVLAYYCYMNSEAYLPVFISKHYSILELASETKLFL
jgi:hypothetical protein